MGSIFGTVFRASTFGESHGIGVGVVVEGCPPGVPIDLDFVQSELDRRRPGQSRITTARAEKDRVEVLSGVHDGHSLGTPIAFLVRNQDARSSDYREIEQLYRPSHADYTYDAKYGRRAVAGGGRASARETIGRVAAGAVAKSLLASDLGVEVLAWVARVEDIAASVDPATVSADAIESNIARCPDAEAAERMIKRIEEVKADGDSVGGLVAAVARNVPPGLGDPVFDKLEADLAKAMLSLPASKSFEIGSGLEGTFQRGSAHNDPFESRGGRIATTTNRSGGVQGGISNGEAITLRVGFKPVATILRPQETVDAEGKAGVLKPRGRHDPCVLPRAVPMVEAMIALVLADHHLRQRAQRGAG